MINYEIGAFKKKIRIIEYDNVFCLSDCSTFFFSLRASN
jgi:hypothetical protein